MNIVALVVICRRYSNIVVEPYNTKLCVRSLLVHADATVMRNDVALDDNGPRVLDRVVDTMLCAHFLLEHTDVARIRTSCFQHEPLARADNFFIDLFVSTER